jgi:hypothetical protein
VSGATFDDVDSYGMLKELYDELGANEAVRGEPQALCKYCGCKIIQSVAILRCASCGAPA